MKKAILATKVGMTQIFNEDGSLIPVTVLQAGPCVVTQIKTEENDGYKAVQVGFVDKKDTIVNSADQIDQFCLLSAGVGNRYSVIEYWRGLSVSEDRPFYHIRNFLSLD